MSFTTSFVSGVTEKNQSIVIDWTGYADEEAASTENIERMISWVKTYPRSEDIHVYLGKVRQKTTGRKLQGALQALGCKVTTKQYN